MASIRGSFPGKLSMEKEKDKMNIKKFQDIAAKPVEEEGVENVLKRILVGPGDGKTQMIMRYFTVLPGGHTPHHSHSHEHVVKIEEGRGVVVDEFGKEHVVAKGQSFLIEGGRNHQFRNPYKKPFEFLCIIRNPEQQGGK
jgi:quercetin dioxygenase-like cupin family protein